MKNNKKRKIIIVLIIAIILMMLIFIPVKQEEFIKYNNPYEDGGASYIGYYNLFGIRIYEGKK